MRLLCNSTSISFLVLALTLLVALQLAEPAESTKSTASQPTAAAASQPAAAASQPDPKLAASQLPRTQLAASQLTGLTGLAGITEMIHHAFDSYHTHAYPADELRPLSCTPTETFGGYALTLIDALDTLLLLGDTARAQTALQSLLDSHVGREGWGALDDTVSAFETNIRIVGGLLSAHALIPDVLGDAHPRHILLDLALDLGDRLLPAFSTPLGLPFCSLHLDRGVARNEPPITSTACAGSFLLEFGALSALSGDPKYYKAARRSWMALFKMSKSSSFLVGSHLSIDSRTPKWTEAKATIGSNVDSFYEYGLKAAILFGDPVLYSAFEHLYHAVQTHLYRPAAGIYVSLDLNSGSLLTPVGHEHLAAFWPGLQVLAGHPNDAARPAASNHALFRTLGGLPERFDVLSGSIPEAAYPGSAAWHTRPEHIESLYYLSLASSHSPRWLARVDDVISLLNTTARTPCGFASLSSVSDKTPMDRMESFVLSETLKYAYLVYATHPSADLSHLPPALAARIRADDWIFTTEAHPLPLSSFWHESLVASGALNPSSPSRRPKTCHLPDPAVLDPAFAGHLPADRAIFPTRLSSKTRTLVTSKSPSYTPLKHPPPPPSPSSSSPSPPIILYDVVVVDSSQSELLRTELTTSTSLKVVPAEHSLGYAGLDAVFVAWIADVALPPDALIYAFPPGYTGPLPTSPPRDTRFSVCLVPKSLSTPPPLDLPPHLLTCTYASGAEFGPQVWMGKYVDLGLPSFPPLSNVLGCADRVFPLTTPARPTRAFAAVVSRGTCLFDAKALAAASDSASGLLVVNDQDVLDITMIPSSPSSPVTAPSFSVPSFLLPSSSSPWLSSLAALASSHPHWASSMTLRVTQIPPLRHLSYSNKVILNIQIFAQ